jgi:hypothetical protein
MGILIDHSMQAARIDQYCTLKFFTDLDGDIVGINTT